VSKIDIETSNVQGGRGVVVGTVRDTAARNVVRGAVPPLLANGRRMGEVWPAVTVKDWAEPIVFPVASTNVTVPVQEAAVPLLEFEATFAMFTSSVCVEPRPTGGRFMVGVGALEVVESANVTDIPVAAIREQTKVLTMKTHLSEFYTESDLGRTRLPDGQSCCLTVGRRFP